jgi:hypothetical protein
MNVNFKRGFLEGAAVAVICTGLLVLIMWRKEGPFTSFSFNDLGLVACATGLLGFMVRAFRANPVTPKK